MCARACVLGHIRGRTIQLDKLKNRIYREIENTDAEEKSLAEYRREMELLLQEKMSHVEELRQIHADINAVSVPPECACACPDTSDTNRTAPLSRWKPSSSRRRKIAPDR